LSFFGQLRSGEPLPPTQNLDLEKFNPRRHATFSDIAESTGWNGACNFHLPWSKSQKARGDDIWIHVKRHRSPLDPIHAIHKHFTKNRLDINHPIQVAAYRDDHGTLITLTRSTIDKQTLSSHYRPLLPHRRDLISGVPPDMVKKFGRWRSQAFLEYWRCLDYLGAIHIEPEMLPLNPDAHRQQRRSLPKA
jgi:hypothetical protein